MKSFSNDLLAVAILAASAASALTAAHAQTVITALPYTITTSGTYVLNSNLASTATTGNLITINASNVTIDFQEHYITGPSNSLSSTSVNGIFARERSNLTIRNGTVAYCYEGILILGNGTATTNNVDQEVTNMRVTYCSADGIDVESAPSTVISGCQVSQIGTSSTSYNAGITLIGGGVVVQGCTVSNITDATGNNSVGIDADTGSFTRQCQVSSAYYGIQNGIYQDNLVSGVASPFTLGTDAGGNFSDATSYNAGTMSASSKVRRH